MGNTITNWVNNVVLGLVVQAVQAAIIRFWRQIVAVIILAVGCLVWLNPTLNNAWTAACGLTPLPNMTTNSKIVQTHYTHDGRMKSLELAVFVEFHDLLITPDGYFIYHLSGWDCVSVVLFTFGMIFLYLLASFAVELFLFLSGVVIDNSQKFRFCFNAISITIMSCSLFYGVKLFRKKPYSGIDSIIQDLIFEEKVWTLTAVAISVFQSGALLILGLGLIPPTSISLSFCNVGFLISLYLFGRIPFMLYHSLVVSSMKLLVILIETLTMMLQSDRINKLQYCLSQTGRLLDICTSIIMGYFAMKSNTTGVFQILWIEFLLGIKVAGSVWAAIDDSGTYAGPGGGTVATLSRRSAQV